MHCPKTPFRYLDKKYVDEKYAAHSVRTEGGHRGDSIPVSVSVLDARPGRATDAVSMRNQLNNQGHCLVDFNEDEWNFVNTIDISAMEHDEFLQKQYYSACEQLALRATGGSFARAFNFTLRDSRIKGIHTKPSGDNSPRGPVNDVHTDYTDQAPSVLAIKHLVRNKMKLGPNVRFALFNVWRSVSTVPIETWPLAVLNANTVESSDLVARITPENDNVIYNVLPNPSQHQWRYYSKMMRNECLVFKQYDTDETNVSRFTPHTAFDIVEAFGTKEKARNLIPPRESCEVRVLVIYNDNDDVDNDSNDDDESVGKILAQTAAMTNGTYRKRTSDVKKNAFDDGIDSRL